MKIFMLSAILGFSLITCYSMQAFAHSTDKHIAANEMTQISQGHAIELTSENFNQEVKQSTQPVIIDFYAPWCNPCKAMLPIVENLSKKYGNSVKFTKLNTDKYRDLSSQYNIQSLPTFLFIKNGQVVGSFTGAISQQEFEAKINDKLLR